MQVCVQRQKAMTHPLDYPSKSSPGKSYRVYLFREGRKLPMCTCMPYLTSRKKVAKELGKAIDDVAGTCSHIKDAHKRTCTWSEDEGGYEFSGRCPKCGSKTVEVDDDGREVSTSKPDAVQALLELQAKRAGKPPPVPAPVELPPKHRVEGAMLVVYSEDPLYDNTANVHVVLDTENEDEIVGVYMDETVAQRAAERRNGGGFDPSAALADAIAGAA